MKKKLRLLTVMIMAALLLLNTMSASVWAASKATPAKPKLVSVKMDNNTGKVTVKWKKAKNATQYNVCYKEQGTSKWICVAKVTGDKTGYTHDPSKSKYKLKAGKKYAYTVRPYNKVAKRYGPYDTKGRVVNVPATSVPRLTGIFIKDGRVTVKWTKAANATRYNVCYKESGSKTWLCIEKVNGNAVSYTHNPSDKYPLKAGKTYTYMIRPYNGRIKKYGSYESRGLTVTVPASGPGHVHSYTTVVASDPGNCMSESYEERRCSCGDVRAFWGPYGSHEWEYVPEQKQFIPHYVYAYECNVCHERFGHDDDAAALHSADVCGGGYSYKQIGVDGGEWVTMADAYYYCGLCGKTKEIGQ